MKNVIYHRYQYEIIYIKNYDTIQKNFLHMYVIFINYFK